MPSALRSIVAVCACICAFGCGDDRGGRVDRSVLPSGDPIDRERPALAPWTPLDATCTPTPDAQAALDDGRTMARFNPSTLDLGPSMGWVEADAACAAMGGVLAQLDDAATRSAADTLAGPVTDAAEADEGWGVWIGLTQAEQPASPEDGWSWRDGTPEPAPAWSDGQPDDDDGNESGDQSCAVLGASGWRDVGCQGSRVWAALCLLPSAPAACIGDAECARASDAAPYACRCAPGQAYAPESGGCVVKPACTRADPDVCDGACDPQDDANSGDCDGVCAANDAPASPDCDAACDEGDAPNSPDCDGVCGASELFSSPDCDDVCDRADAFGSPDCDTLCDFDDAFGSPDCDDACDPEDFASSLDCDGACDDEDMPDSPDCDGVCDDDDSPDSEDCR